MTHGCVSRHGSPGGVRLGNGEGGCTLKGYVRFRKRDVNLSVWASGVSSRCGRTSGARDAARERAKAEEKETNKWLREHERESQRCARSIMCFAEHIAKAREFSW
uniref:Uncharacterized protein n=1 Tax=Ascaris lumbricoides TaxID=6252 RepID=A0A0M3I4E4_ASCLU